MRHTPRRGAWRGTAMGSCVISCGFYRAGTLAACIAVVCVSTRSTYSALPCLSPLHFTSSLHDGRAQWWRDCISKRAYPCSRSHRQQPVWAETLYDARLLYGQTSYRLTIGFAPCQGVTGRLCVCRSMYTSNAWLPRSGPRAVSNVLCWQLLTCCRKSIGHRAVSRASHVTA